jgi:DNA-binding response OmpR family regulator
MAVVLLADHIPLHADALEMNLLSKGHHVVRAEDAKTALDYLRDNTPDLIILEGDLPLMSGLAVCNLVKSVKRLKKVPVLMWEEQVATAILEVGVAKPDVVLSRVAPWAEFRETARLLLSGKTLDRTPILL